MIITVQWPHVSYVSHTVTWRFLSFLLVTRISYIPWLKNKQSWHEMFFRNFIAVGCNSNAGSITAYGCRTISSHLAHRSPHGRERARYDHRTVSLWFYKAVHLSTNGALAMAARAPCCHLTEFDAKPKRLWQLLPQPARPCDFLIYHPQTCSTEPHCNLTSPAWYVQLRMHITATLWRPHNELVGAATTMKVPYGRLLVSLLSPQGISYHESYDCRAIAVTFVNTAIVARKAVWIVKFAIKNLRPQNHAAVVGRQHYIWLSDWDIKNNL